MKYELKSATNKEIDLLIKYKLASILDYATDISEDEKKRIIDYVNSNIPSVINEYQLIIYNEQIIGCLHTSKHEDGILLDEIYIDKSYQNKGIGSSIIKSLIIDNKIIYLWVYKENKNAINLYQKLNFLIIEETETRYYMQYKGE